MMSSTQRFGARGVWISVAVVLGVAVVTSAVTAAYYRYFVIRAMDLRLVDADRSVQELQGRNALLSTKLDETRRAYEQEDARHA